jgi:hypothetical protein
MRYGIYLRELNMESRRTCAFNKYIVLDNILAYIIVTHVKSCIKFRFNFLHFSVECMMQVPLSTKCTGKIEYNYPSVVSITVSIAFVDELKLY